MSDLHYTFDYYLILQFLIGAVLILSNYIAVYMIWYDIWYDMIWYDMIGLRHRGSLRYLGTQ